MPSITIPIGSKIIANSISFTTTPPSSADDTLMTNPFDVVSIAAAVPSKYSTYMALAAIRWNNLVNINFNIYNQLKSLYASENWKGMTVSTYDESYIAPAGPGAGVVIASCGPEDVYDIITPGPAGTEFVAAKFGLFVNNYFDTRFTETDWVDVFTHELGHALGIGTFWQSVLAPYGAVAPQNNLLNGVAYEKSLAAYKSIAGPAMNTRTKIPLESSGGSGTNSAHWENDFRPQVGSELSYYGLTNELMVGFKGNNFIISKLTIDTLVDMGYEERNPGTNEGTPVLASSLMSSLQALSQDPESGVIKLDCEHCGCSDKQTKVIGQLTK